ncbi:MAG: hypothetical protein DLM52_12275 [Chthoniobacterales bacterium]|nr:MAG: hypothetical protein DLM52_12275 [Chthoniobacterales bacterium]
MHHVRTLHVIEQLELYATTLSQLPDEEYPYHAIYSLLQLDVSERKLQIKNFKRVELEEATRQADDLESEGDLDVVLVKVGTLKQLRRAYPNYFADTTLFLEHVRTVMETPMLRRAPQKYRDSKQFSAGAA